MKRISLFLVTGLLAVGATGFAADVSGPDQTVLDSAGQDALAESFSRDLHPQPLVDHSTQGYKLEAVEEFLPEQSEHSNVLGDVKSFAKSTLKGTYKVVTKPPTLLFDGIKSFLDLIPGAGGDSDSEKVETVESPGVPSLELSVGNEERYTFFEREFAKQLASHRTAQDFNDPAEEELRGKKVLKILLLQMDFGSDK